MFWSKQLDHRYLNPIKKIIIPVMCYAIYLIISATESGLMFCDLSYLLPMFNKKATPPPLAKSVKFGVLGAVTEDPIFVSIEKFHKTFYMVSLYGKITHPKFVYEKGGVLGIP